MCETYQDFVILSKHCSYYDHKHCCGAANHCKPTMSDFDIQYGYYKTKEHNYANENQNDASLFDLGVCDFFKL